MIQDFVLAKKDQYNGNRKLKKSNVQFQYERDHIEEIIKCKEDIIYFIKNYVKIINLDKGLMNFDLFPYQEEVIKTVDSNRFVIALLSRQMGKCLCINTNITVRNKKTGEVLEIPIGEFYEMQKLRSGSDSAESN
jgi:hypothetical protein